MKTSNAPRKSVKRASVIKSISVSHSPWDAVGVGNEVYVSRSSTLYVSVIDSDSNEVVADVPTVLYVRDLLYNPSEGKVYAIGNGHDSLTVIDVSANHDVFEFGTVRGPDSMALSHDGKELYICGHNGSISRVGRYDVEDAYNLTGEVGKVLNLKGIACGDPSQTPEGKRYLYACSYDTDEIRIIEVVDAETLIFIEPAIKVGQHPTAITINAAGTHAYVANTDSNSISVIDLNTHVVIATIKVGERPGKVKINPVTGWIYVSNVRGQSPNKDGSISIIDPSTYTVFDTLNVKGSPLGIGFSSDGLYAYVCTLGNDEVHVIELGVQ